MFATAAQARSKRAQPETDRENEKEREIARGVGCRVKFMHIHYAPRTLLTRGSIFHKDTIPPQKPITSKPTAAADNKTPSTEIEREKVTRRIYAAKIRRSAVSRMQNEISAYETVNLVLWLWNGAVVLSDEWSGGLWVVARPMVPMVLVF